MEYISVPIIVICCYIIGEIYKIVFIKNEKAYKFIPIFLAICGGIIGIIIYFTNPEIIKANNVWIALEIGMFSGVSSTGTNQIIKQLFKEENNVNK